jgi:hypothetical protein
VDHVGIVPAFANVFDAIPESGLAYAVASLNEADGRQRKFLLASERANVLEGEEFNGHLA